MSLVTLEYVGVIVFIGGVYWFFTRFDANQAEKRTDRFIRKQEIKLKQEEIKLKQEIVRMEREKNAPKGIQAEYSIKDELEDKSEKEPKPES